MTSVYTEDGKIVDNNRTYKAVPDYTTVSKFGVGIKQGTLLAADTDLDYVVPINNGTVNDNGDNTFTGSSGGDNSTDNTTTFKPGAGETDNTAQNLISNNTNVTKIWTIADLSSSGINAIADQPFAMWIYIKDAAALAKFLIAGTALEIKLGSDSSNYYSKTFELTDLATGWNWITSNTVNVEDLTETGTVVGDIDTFLIEIITNNATDVFIAGDVIYDLLRQWEVTDTVKTFIAGFPAIDEGTFKVKIKGSLTSVQANGFDLSGFKVLNTDTVPKVTDLSDYTAESKSDTDEFIYELDNSFL